MIPSTFANPEKCRGSDVIQAAQELATSHSRGTLRLYAPSGSFARELIVDYEPYPEMVRITATDGSISKISLAMQIDNSIAKTCPVSVVWHGGEAIAYISALTRHLRFESSGYDGEPRVMIPKDGFWKRIEGRGNVPKDVIDGVAAIVTAIDTGPRECTGTAAWCAKYMLKFLASGTLCALSAGIDGLECQGAIDQLCSWCDCKGYDCDFCS